MRLLQTLLVTLAFCLGIIAQDSELNSRAVSLPPPHYPATAMAVNAGGPVRVEVLVSESGRVITATAVSGHPLLRGPAAEAARKAIFKPATVNNVPVQFSGFLIYQFPPKYVKADVDFTWLSFSLNLGALRAVGTDSDLKLITAQSSKMLPEEFAEEKKLLANLANVSGAGQHEIINQVIDSFQTKLHDEEAWQFLMGLEFGKTMGLAKRFMIDRNFKIDETAFKATMQRISQYAAIPPANVPQDVVESFQTFSSLGNRSDLKFSEVLANTIQSGADILRLMMSKAKVGR